VNKIATKLNNKPLAINFRILIIDNKRLQISIYESKRLLTESFFVVTIPLCCRKWWSASQSKTTF